MIISMNFIKSLQHEVTTLLKALTELESLAYDGDRYAQFNG